MPASFATTARNALRYMLGTDLISDVDEGFQRLAEDVDTKMASYSQGTLAARPAAGQPNRFYKITDANLLVHDNGSTWEPVWPPLAQRSVSGTTTAKDGDYCEGSGTLNLPAPAVNTIIGAFALTTMKIVAAPPGVGIFGDLLGGSESMELQKYQRVLLLADGSNWLIISGGPFSAFPANFITGGIGGSNVLANSTQNVNVRAGALVRFTGLFKMTGGSGGTPSFASFDLVRDSVVVASQVVEIATAANGVPITPMLGYIEPSGGNHTYAVVAFPGGTGVGLAAEGGGILTVGP